MYLHVSIFMNKSDKIIYYITTGLLSALALFSAGMYLFTYPQAVESYTLLGFPVYIIYPLAILKILGVAAIWSNISTTLKYLAYAGFFYNFVLAVTAHLNANDGEFMAAAIGVVFVVTSFIFDRRITKAKA